MSGRPADSLPLVPSRHGLTFGVRVVPRAGRSVVAGRRGDMLLVRLSAAPVDGAANEALLTLLADLLHSPRRDLALVSGARSRDKRVAVSGLSEPELRAKLSAILPPDPGGADASR